MAKCQSNNIGSLALDQSPATSSASGGHFRLWTAFSAASFRRKIFDAVSCGGSSRYRLHEDDFSYPSAASTATAVAEKLNSSGNVIERGKSRSKSEKLSDLLSFAEVDTEIETKKKVEALEKLKNVVKELQIQDQPKRNEAGACRVRFLAKEDSAVRSTLAMLGAIPPLVGMLDSDDS